jgi:hypothetical protein
MTADNPVTGRRFLTESAYADDRHLRSRMGIWAYAEAAPDPGWRLAAVPWDGTQVVADVGCGNGFDLRQLVPGGRCGHAVGIDLTCCQKLQTDHTRRPPSSHRGLRIPRHAASDRKPGAISCWRACQRRRPARLPCGRSSRETRHRRR